MDGSTDEWIDETTDGWMCGGIEGGPAGTAQTQFACVSLLLTTLLWYRNGNIPKKERIFLGSY